MKNIRIFFLKIFLFWLYNFQYIWIGMFSLWDGGHYSYPHRLRRGVEGIKKRAGAGNLETLSEELNETETIYLELGNRNYCPFYITGKDVFFLLGINFKWKYFLLIDHILSETICLFCFCILFSNMYPKIKFTVKNWSSYAISVVKWAFGIFL